MNLLLLVSALAAFAAGAVAQLTINTPPQSQAQQCEPLQISWSGGTPPYFVFLCSVENSPITATPFVNFGQQTGTSLTWEAVNATIGTQLILQIKDNTGDSRTSATFSVIGGVGDSCLGSSGSSSSGTQTSTEPGSSTSSPSSTGSNLPGKPTKTASAAKKANVSTGVIVSSIILLAFLS
ncbi:hypothetical protein C8F01DRAFT_1259989 [Mycena amicta]|nr:hypothetical protein C8F01DRAFT_1259989 [Mycena amicta]